MIIIIIIAIIALSYFGVSLRSLFDNDLFKNNIGYVWRGVVYTWDNFLAGPAEYLWNDVFIELIWEPAIDALTKIKNGESPDMIENGVKTP